MQVNLLSQLRIAYCFLMIFLDNLLYFRMFLLLYSGASWRKLAQVGASWRKLAQVGASWRKLAQVGASWKPIK